MATFDMNLSGLTLLTEAASGYYSLTPLIAALAGAERVYALARDSEYGEAKSVGRSLISLSERWGTGDRVEVLFSREDTRIGRADIVLNLGFVRPLDAVFLRRLKRSAVIPLMFETWEHRSEDLDVQECRRLGLPVLGTNEHHPDLRIFDYVGLIAMKMLFNLDFEVFRSHLVVIGSGEFGEQVTKSLQCAGAHVTWISNTAEKHLRSDANREALRKAGAAVIVEHHHRHLLFGDEGDLSAEELRHLRSDLIVIHICGGVDRTSLQAKGIRCYPERFAPPGYMSVGTDYLGPKPLIDLHTAGMKVGEMLARARERGLSAEQSERYVLETSSLAQGFPDHLQWKGLIL